MLFRMNQPEAAIPSQEFELHNVWQQAFSAQCDQDGLDEQRGLLRQIVNGLAEEQSDPAIVETLGSYQSVVEYLWFDPIDATVPEAFAFEALEFTAKTEGYGLLILDSPLLTHTVFEAITKTLKWRGLRSLLSIRKSNFERNQGYALDVLQRSIAETPSAQWVQGMLAAGRETRMTREQRDLQEAIHYNSVVQKFAHLPPDQLYNNRRLIGEMTTRLNYDLDERPGHRRLPDAQFDVRDSVAAFVLNSFDEEFEGVRLRADTLELLDAAGWPIARHGIADIFDHLQSRGVIAQRPSMGAEDLSTETMYRILMKGLAGFGSRSEDLKGHMLMSTIDETTTVHRERYLRGFNLLSSNAIETTIQALKTPPANTPFRTASYDGDEEGDRPFTLNRQLPQEADEMHSKSEQVHLALRQFREAEAERSVPLYDQAVLACQSVITDFNRYLTLDPKTTEQELCATLGAQGWSQNHVLVNLLGALLSARDELAAGNPLSQDSVTELLLTRQRLDTILDGSDKQFEQEGQSIVEKMRERPRGANDSYFEATSDAIGPHCLRVLDQFIKQAGIDIDDQPALPAKKYNGSEQYYLPVRAEVARN